MTEPRASLRSDNCPNTFGIGVRFGLEQLSDFIGMRRPQCQKHTSGRRKAQHGCCRAWTTEPIHSAEVLALKRTAMPPGKPTSAAQPQPHSDREESLTS